MESMTQASYAVATDVNEYTNNSPAISLEIKFTHSDAFFFFFFLFIEMATVKEMSIEMLIECILPVCVPY